MAGLPSSPRTWPPDFEDRRAGAGCAMCATAGVEDNGFGVRFFQGPHLDAYLQRVAYLPGYTVAIWRGAHVAEITDLSDAEVGAFWIEAATAGRLLQRAYNPIKLNWQALGNSLPHLHVHVVPRYPWDDAPAGPKALPGDELPRQEEDDFTAQVRRLRALQEENP